MNPLKIIFFVNGSQDSAAGVRARLLVKHFSPTCRVEFLYRPSKKWKGIFPFIISALKFKPDVIYVMDTAYTGVLAGCFTKKLIRCRLVVDTGDVAYELARSTGSYSTFQCNLINWIEQLAIRHSDILLVRGSYHKEWLIAQGVTWAEFVPDGVEIAEIKEANRTLNKPCEKSSLGLDNTMVVGMIGTMAWSERHQMTYGWDIVEALAYLKDIPIQGLLVGDGDGKAILEAKAEELGVKERIVFAGRVAYDELPQYLAAMDICISTQSNDLVGNVRTTGKLPLYLAFGKYVVATDVGEAKKVLPGIGHLLPYEGVRDNEHPKRLANHLRQLWQRPEQLETACLARKVAQENFDYKLLAERVEKLLLELGQS